MYFIGAEEGSENEMEITSETSVANTNGALAAVKYATPPQGNVQSMYDHKYLTLLLFVSILQERTYQWKRK